MPLPRPSNALPGPGETRSPRVGPTTASPRGLTAVVSSGAGGCWHPSMTRSHAPGRGGVLAGRLHRAGVLPGVAADMSWRTLKRRSSAEAGRCRRGRGSTTWSLSPTRARCAAAVVSATTGCRRPGPTSGRVVPRPFGPSPVRRPAPRPWPWSASGSCSAQYVSRTTSASGRSAPCPTSCGNLIGAARGRACHRYGKGFNSPATCPCAPRRASRGSLLFSAGKADEACRC